MKIPAITNFKKYIGIGIITSAIVAATPNKKHIMNELYQNKDTFEYTTNNEDLYETTGIDVSEFTDYNEEKIMPETLLPSAKGSSSEEVLAYAPSPKVYVMGEEKNATIVVNLSNNVLFHYDEGGNPDCAYRIASGKPRTPTHTGLRVVTHVETYPYRNAPQHTKRYKNPRDYGPKIIMLNKLNPQTGERSEIGEFIHGNRNSATLGQYVSHGCMRMDNEVIKELAAKAKRGDIVLIKD